jgi:hypothetical protein
VPISDIGDYSMISSAAAEKAIGTSMPNALAVLRLRTNSKLGRLHHRQLTGLVALENARDIDAGLTIGIDVAGSIARQTAGVDKLTPIVHGWHLVTRGERDKLLDVVAVEGVGAEQQRTDPALAERRGSAARSAGSTARPCSLSTARRRP